MCITIKKGNIVNETITTYIIYNVIIILLNISRFLERANQPEGYRILFIQRFAFEVVCTRAAIVARFDPHDVFAPEVLG